MIFTTPVIPTRHGEWVLTDDVSFWYKFGHPDFDPVALVSAPQVSAVKATLQQYVSAGRSGAVFGTDTPHNMTVSLAGVSSPYMSDDPRASATQWVDAFTRGLHAPINDVQRLIGHYDGQTRYVVGRCRDVTQDADMAHVGKTLMTAEFETVTGQFYGDRFDYQVPYWLSSGTPGWVFDMQFPIKSTTSATYGGAPIELASAVWPIVQFYGPITDPSLHVWTAGISVGLAGHILPDDAVTVDTRPWRRTVTHSNGESWAGRLTGGSTHDRTRLPAGTHRVALRGNDPTRTAHAIVTYSPEYPHY